MKNLVSLCVFCAATSVALFESAGRAADQPDTLEARLAPSVGGGLTSEQVGFRAQETSFEVAGRRHAIASAEAKLEQAKVAFVPKLTLTARYTRLSPVDPIVFAPGQSIEIPVDQYLAQASLTVPLSDYVLRLSQSYASASRSQQAAALDEQAGRLKAAVDARDLYYAWLRAKAEVVVSERALEQAKAHLAEARHSFDVGTASKADVLRVESQLANAELLVERSRDLAVLSEDQIRTAMHDSSTRSYAIGEDLHADPPPVAGADNLGALRTEALDRRLEVRALDQTAWSLREQAKVARAGYYPRLDAFGDVVYAKPNPRVFIPTPEFRTSWDAGVQLVWTLNDTLSAGSIAADAEARAAQIDMQKAALRDAVKLEVMQAYQALRQAQFAVQTTKRGLAAAEEGYRVRHELFLSGRATSVELTDAEIELIRASLESVNARVDQRAARARLLHAVGRDVSPALAAR